MTFCYLLQGNSLDIKHARSAVGIFEPCAAFHSKMIERVMAPICLCLSSELSGCYCALVEAFSVASMSAGSSD